METPLRDLDKQIVLNIFRLVKESWPKDVNTTPDSDMIKKTAEVSGICMATVYDIIKEDKRKDQVPPPGQVKDQTELVVLETLQEEGQHNAEIRQEQLREPSLTSVIDDPLETSEVEWPRPQPIKAEPFGTYDTNETLATQLANKRKKINILKQSAVTSTKIVRSRANRIKPKQFAALLDFMESHGDILRPLQGPQGRIKADRLWQELADLLNSIVGGVKKSLDKWKKVWADWKTKTKKKAVAIRNEAFGTGGPSSSQTLTAPEERVLAIMGLAGVTGQAGIKDRGFEDSPSELNSLPLPTGEYTVVTVHAVCPSNPSDYRQASIPTAPPSLPPPSGELPHHSPPPVLTTSPTTATPQGPPQRRRPRWSTATGRRQRTPFERGTSDFMAVEQLRLQLEADRERNHHDREMERLRLESRRIEMVEKQNLILSRLAGAVDNLIEILPQLRPSLPSTNIIP